MTQLDINMRDSEIERERTHQRILTEFTKAGACYFCGCLEEGTLEYEDEIVKCYVCNKDG